MPSNILLQGDPVYTEGKAASTITPGDLIEPDASSNLQRQSSAGQDRALPQFARENDAGGDSISTDYSADDNVLAFISRTGDKVYGYIAAGENVADGDALEPDGNGSFQALGTSGGTAPTAYAAEDKDNAGGGSRVRIKIRVA